MRARLWVLIVLVVSLGCASTSMVDLRDNATSLRGVVRAGSSLDQDWNVDVWMDVKSRSGRPASFVLLPQGSMVWEAADYKGFYLYAEAWRYDQNNRKKVLAKTKSPARIAVSSMTDRDGYGWSVDIEAEKDGNRYVLYVYQRPPPSRWGRGGWYW